MSYAALDIQAIFRVKIFTDRDFFKTNILSKSLNTLIKRIYSLSILKDLEATLIKVLLIPKINDG